MQVTPPNKKRSSNLELYRIIVMFFIVCHHYVVNSGLTSVMHQYPLGMKTIFLSLWGMWGKVGINCFVLITGYFMCKKSISLRKFLKLLLQIEFYNIIIYSIFVLSGYTDFNIIQFTKAVLPVTKITNNFVACFLLFYLCIPFLNIFVNGMNKKQHAQCILLTLFIYSILGHVFEISMNYVSWFCILYVIASYIRFYGVYKEVSVRFWGNMTLLCSIMAMLSVFFMRAVFNKGMYFFVADCNKLLGVMVAVSSFCLFKNLKIKHNSFINYVGACTFGVLLIHTRGDLMRTWLWKDFFDNVGWYNSDYFLLHALSVPLAIFIIGVIVDSLRSKYFESPALDFTMKMVKKIINR